MKSELTTHQITIPKSEDWVIRVKECAKTNVKKYGSCTQGILAAFMQEFGINDPMVIRSAGAMHLGMVSSLTCGIHTAGLMILGLIMGRGKLEMGMDGLSPIFLPAQELIKRLNSRLGSHSCKELTGVDFTDLKQIKKFRYSNGQKECICRVADGAEEIGLFLKELEEKGDLFQNQ